MFALCFSMLFSVSRGREHGWFSATNAAVLSLAERRKAALEGDMGNQSPAQ